MQNIFSLFVLVLLAGTSAAQTPTSISQDTVLFMDEPDNSFDLPVKYLKLAPGDAHRPLVAPFRENGKFGLRTEEGKIIVPAEYNTYAAVEKGYWGLQTTGGNLEVFTIKGSPLPLAELFDKENRRKSLRGNLFYQLNLNRGKILFTDAGKAINTSN